MKKSLIIYRTVVWFINIHLFPNYQYLEVDVGRGDCATDVVVHQLNKIYYKGWEKHSDQDYKEMTFETCEKEGISTEKPFRNMNFHPIIMRTCSSEKNLMLEKSFDKTSYKKAFSVSH